MTNRIKKSEAELESIAPNDCLQAIPIFKSYLKEETKDDSSYNFQAFIAQLKDNRAEPIMKYTKSFVYNFMNKRESWSVHEQVKLVNDFKTFIYNKFELYEPFKSLDPSKIQNAQEGIEKLIMGKLYSKCFSPNININLIKLHDDHKQDILQDIELKKKILEYSFISPHNLEVPQNISSKFDHFVKIASNELNKINNYRAPRDKMICVLNCCKVIFSLLKHSKLEDSGADHFVPLLIYTVLSSNVESLVSNVNYIERFRLPEFLQGENAYYLSSLQGAIRFILNINTSSLKIKDQTEFDKCYEEHKKTIQLISKNNIHEEAKCVPQKVTSLSPSEYILRPLDEVANTVFVKFSELILQKGENSSKINRNNKYEQSSNTYDDAEATILVNNIETAERLNILQSLQAIFPDIDQEIICDICEASNYRIGVCVDALLSLSN